MSSFLQVIDFGLRTLLYNKFYDILDLESVNRGVVVYPKEVAFRKVSEKKGAMITSFVNLWRMTTAPDWNRLRTSVARTGMNLRYTDTNYTDAVVVKAVPVALKYDVCFWTKDIEKINLIAERYLFWQHSNPNLNLSYTVGGNDYPVELDLHFGEMVDESQVERMLDIGTHFRLSVPVSVDGWVFASEEIGVIQKIELLLYDGDDLTDAGRRSIVLENDDSDFDGDLEEALRLYEEHIFGIINVSVSSSSFTIAGEHASEFGVGQIFYVDDSTGNDGRYTVVSATNVGGNTVIVVVEGIDDSTVDGSVSLKNV